MAYVRSKRFDRGWRRVNLKSPWNDDALCKRFEELFALTGHSYLSGDEIADALNKEFGTAFTRNAIIGRSGEQLAADGQTLRAKYPRSKAKPGPKRTAKSRRPYRAPGAITSTQPMQSPIGANLARAIAAPKPEPKPIAFDGKPGGIRMLDAQDGQCRWPMADNAQGEAMCCGATTENKRIFMCPTHKRESVDRARTAHVQMKQDNTGNAFGMKRRSPGRGALNRF